MEVDHLTGFSRHLTPIQGFRARPSASIPTSPASLPFTAPRWSPVARARPSLSSMVCWTL